MNSSAANMVLTQDRTQEIKNELVLLNHTLKMSVQKAIKIGQLLMEQKEFVGHGKFLSWLGSNLDISVSTAEKYMGLSQHQDKIVLSTNLQEAYRQIETIEAQEKMSKEERDRGLIAEFRKTGIKPIGWTDKLDKAVKDSDAAFAKQQERIDKFKQEQNRKSEEDKPQKPLPADADHYYRLGKLTEEMLNNASTATTTHTNKRLQWKEKIRLSDGGKEDAFMDAIIDYMETLENDNRRIEACNNIIKICRNISVELQKANK